MAPEYAMEGTFSFKSDVFSYGVLLLEILSGQRNGASHVLQRGQTLLRHVCVISASPLLLSLPSLGTFHRRLKIQCVGGRHGNCGRRTEPPSSWIRRSETVTLRTKHAGVSRLGCCACRRAQTTDPPCRRCCWCWRVSRCLSLCQMNPRRSQGWGRTDSSHRLPSLIQLERILWTRLPSRWSIHGSACRFTMAGSLWCWTFFEAKINVLLQMTFLHISGESSSMHYTYNALVIGSE